MYSYVIEATNAYGSVQSAPISFQTPPGPPEGVVNLVVTNVQAKNATFSWNEPQLMNGPLWKYVLYSHTERDPTRVDQWEGTELQVTLGSLTPFTNFTFHVDSCTTGGCLQSEPVTFMTLSAIPEGMQPPVVLAVNNTALLIKWEPPAQPNGRCKAPYKESTLKCLSIGTPKNNKFFHLFQMGKFIIFRCPKI